MKFPLFSHRERPWMPPLCPGFGHQSTGRVSGNNFRCRTVCLLSLSHNAPCCFMSSCRAYRTSCACLKRSRRCKAAVDSMPWSVRCYAGGFRRVPGPGVDLRRLMVFGVAIAIAAAAAASPICRLTDGLTQIGECTAHLGNFERNDPRWLMAHASIAKMYGTAHSKVSSAESGNEPYEVERPAAFLHGPGDCALRDQSPG